MRDSVPELDGPDAFAEPLTAQGTFFATTPAALSDAPAPAVLGPASLPSSSIVSEADSTATATTTASTTTSTTMASAVTTTAAVTSSSFSAINSRKRKSEVAMKAQEAIQFAASEGLVLERAPNSSGYAGVQRDPVKDGSTRNAFKVTLWQGGRRAYLGTFATCEEAALVYQRAKRRSDECEPNVLSAEAALQMAAREGLALLLAPAAPGEHESYAGVAHRKLFKGKPFEATVRLESGRERSLGHFASQEEAALEVARDRQAKQVGGSRDRT